jgi:hypothetical protein
MCKTLHALGAGNPNPTAFATALADLGRHSAPTALQTGTVQFITSGTFRAWNYNIDDLLAVEQTALSGLHQWVLKDVYIVSVFKFPQEETALAKTVCAQNCTDDLECIAAHMNTNLAAGSSVQVLECYNFHHSDSITSNWTIDCRASVDGPVLSCTSIMANQLWWIKSTNSL